MQKETRYQETKEEQELNSIISEAGEQARQEYKNARNVITESLRNILD